MGDVPEQQHGLQAVATAIEKVAAAFHEIARAYNDHSRAQMEVVRTFIESTDRRRESDSAPSTSEGSVRSRE